MAIRQSSQSLRIAAILVLARGSEVIGVQDMENGVRITEYYAQHARRASQAMRKQRLPDGPKRIVESIKRRRLTQFTPRDVQRGPKFKDVEEINMHLRWLEGHGYCRIREDVGSQGAGRPKSPTYETNPNLFAQ